MYCNGPVERTALEWRLLYGRIFRSVVILSEKKDVDLVVEEGHLDYAYRQVWLYFTFPSIIKSYMIVTLLLCYLLMVSCNFIQINSETECWPFMIT